MTIHLPSDLEHSIEAIVNSGRFSSVDEAMAEAARRLIKDLNPQGHAEAVAEAGELGPDLLLGSMRDYADEMDEIVAEAMRQRQEPWRDIDL